MQSARPSAAAQRARADLARTRFVARGQRLAREQAEKVARVTARREALAQEQAAAPPQAGGDETTPPAAVAATAPRMDKSAVLAAIARGKAKRAQNTPPREDEA
jgi:electron transport complex protein RnfC